MSIVTALMIFKKNIIPDHCLNAPQNEEQHKE